MSDFIISYLLIDRIGIAVAVGILALVFAVAHSAWRRIGPVKKSAGD